MAKKKKVRAAKKVSKSKKSSKKRAAGKTAVRTRSISDKPGWMGIEEVHLMFTTKDPHAAAFFYRETLGFPFAPEKRRPSAPKPGFAYHDDSRGVLTLRSSRDTSIHFQDYNLAYHWVAQLGGRPPEEPLYGQIYFIVRDVDRIYEQLSRKGVQFFGPPRDVPWGYRTLECADPEGRRVVFAEAIKKRK